RHRGSIRPERNSHDGLVMPYSGELATGSHVPHAAAVVPAPSYHAGAVPVERSGQHLLAVVTQLRLRPGGGAGSGVPQPRRLLGHGQEQPAVRAEQGLPDRARVRELEEFFSRAGVTDPGGAVRARGAKAPAVAAELGVYDRTAVPRRPADFPTV